jgi:multidrug transporter EmrE-like cation transporter
MNEPVITTADDRTPALPSAAIGHSSISPSPLLNPYLHLFLTVAFVTIGEVLLKQGAADTAHRGVDWLGLNSLPSPHVWAGAVMLTLSSITWIIVLRVMPLYLAFTLSSAVHVTIPICSWLVLGERINSFRWAGISLVLAGIWIIARPACREEANK